MVFWSQAIIHAISFIDWPLDLFHNFLYFLASLIEVMAFSQMTNPPMWFLFLAGFFIVAQVLYIYDMKLIGNHRAKYSKTEDDKKLYQHIVSRQVFEMKFIVPFGIVYNLLAVFLILNFPAQFIGLQWHFVIAVVEVLFIGGVLFNSITSFKKRSMLIGESATK